jgi:hypothetical protein
MKRVVNSFKSFPSCEGLYLDVWFEFLFCLGSKAERFENLRGGEKMGDQEGVFGGFECKWSTLVSNDLHDSED